MKRSERKSDSAEPYFYIALVLKGSEKQYLNLLKYVNNRNGAQVIYQSKSLTYLRIAHDESPKHKTISKEPSLELKMQEVETA